MYSLTFSHHNLSNYVIKKAVISGVSVTITKPIFVKGGHADPGYHLTPLRTTKIWEKADRDLKYCCKNHEALSFPTYCHEHHDASGNIVWLIK